MICNFFHFYKIVNMISNVSTSTNIHITCNKKHHQIKYRKDVEDVKIAAGIFEGVLNETSHGKAWAWELVTIRRCWNDSALRRKIQGERFHVRPKIVAPK